MNSFLNACGMRRSLRIEVANRITNRLEVRLLDHPFAVIGRDSNCDIVLADKQVSRKHAYLQAIRGQLFWVDLESQIGTFAEGYSWKSGWLGNGRTITIGPNEIRVADEEDAPGHEGAGLPQGSPLIWRTYGDGPLVDATIEFLNGPSESKTWPIRRVLSLIGTARRCKFRLADRSIEPFHCSLLRTDQGLYAIDLVGGGGIQINDVPARSGLLRDGDMLQVGRYQIRVHIHDRNVSVESGIAVAGPEHSGTLVGASDPEQPLVPLSHLPPSPMMGSNLRAEIVGYEPATAYPAPAGRNDLTESVLVPLVSQFGMMQQQMFDQFQQTMNMLVQMFGKMHESQMEMIRQEFSRLNDLSTELNELKAELSEIGRRQAEAKSAPVVPAAGPIPAPTITPAPGTRPTIPGANPSPGPRPTIPRPGGLPPLKPRGGSGSSEQPSTTAQNVSASDQQPKGESQPDNAPQNDQEVIFWLHQRITHIQTEREGRWQRLLKLLPGAS